MDQVLEASLARPRFYMALFTGFGVVALILSAAGIFGVASYTVTQRSQEVGVRIALGAGRLHVLRAVVGMGAVLTAGGIVAGLVAARLLTRFLEGVLFGIRPNDPSTFAAVAGLLTLVAISAFWVPARRATKLDPIGALKAE